MGDLGTGVTAVQAPPVRGTLRVLVAPEDVLDLLDHGADHVIALVRDAGATFLAPVFHELRGVVCTGGTPASHIGIVSREFSIPCVMGCTFPGVAPADGTEVELDCSGPTGVLRVAH